MYCLPYFLSKEVYVFSCECGVSAYGKNSPRPTIPIPNEVSQV